MVHKIIGLQLKERQKLAAKVQSLLSEYGCIIKTRVGLHDVHKEKCSETGIILLEMHGPDRDIHEFEKDIRDIDGVTVKEMVFD